MRYLTQNGMYFRSFKGVTDPLVMQCGITRNKKALERKFYDNDLVCSWSAKYSADFKGDMLYCKGIGDDSVELSRINSLFSEITENFSLPSYEEYENFYNISLKSANISKKILESLTGKRANKLDKKAFDIENERIYQNIKNGFVGITALKKEKSNSPPINGHENKNIPDGVLTFMGCCQTAEANNIRTMLIYKLLEKYYGSGENDTLYSYYRGRGDTYLSFSGYSTDKNLFYTGIMSGYNEDIYDDVTTRIRNVRFEENKLDTIKKRLKDDIYFSAFQFGEQLTITPYILHTGKETTVSEITDIISNITIDEISAAAAAEKYSLKVVMQ